MNYHANDLPQISSTAYGVALNAAGLVGGPNVDWTRVLHGAQGLQIGVPVAQAPASIFTKTEEKPMAYTCRLVKVFIADADENVPLDKRMIYKGDETLTDLTDQELFFEVPLTDLLAKHNEFRKTLEDKKANKDKPVMLEPIRVRDLKMLVVALANF